MSTSIIKALPGKLDIKRHSSSILYISASLTMSSSVLKALPGKLDIKRHSSSILYLFSIAVGSVLIFVTRKANSEELATNLLSRDFKREYLQQGVHLEDLTLVLMFYWSY